MLESRIWADSSGPMAGLLPYSGPMAGLLPCSGPMAGLLPSAGTLWPVFLLEWVPLGRSVPVANPSPLSDTAWSVGADCWVCNFDSVESLWVGLTLPCLCVTPGVTTVPWLFSCGTTLGGSLPPSAITPLPVWADVTGTGRGFTPCFLVGRNGTSSHSLSVSTSLSLSSANAWYRLVSSSGGEVCRPFPAPGFFLTFQEARLQPVGDPTAAGPSRFPVASRFPKGE